MQIYKIIKLQQIIKKKKTSKQPSLYEAYDGQTNKRIWNAVAMCRQNAHAQSQAWKHHVIKVIPTLWQDQILTHR